MRQFSGQFRYRSTTWRRQGWIACCVAGLLLSTNVGHPQSVCGETQTSTSNNQHNVVRPPATELSDVALARSFRRLHRHASQGRIQRFPGEQKSSANPQGTQNTLPTVEPPHRLPPVIAVSAHRVVALPTSVQVVEQPSLPEPNRETPGPPTVTNAAPPLPPEPRSAAEAISSSQSSQFDPELFPELAQGHHMLPGISATDNRSRHRDPQAIRKTRGQASWQRQHVSWEPTNLSYTPLYFEDDRLERHGHHLGVLQPVASGIRFFGTVPALPYLATQPPPGTVVYPLGQTRPGDQIAPYHERPSFHWKAALTAAGTWVGFFTLFP